MPCLVLGISSCAAPPRVAVEERDVLTARQEVEAYGGQLIRYVQPGDTLHGLAFVHDLDIKKLAAWNGLKEADQIQVGQRIRLTEPIGFVYPKPPAVIVNRDQAQSNSNASTRDQSDAAVNEGNPPVAPSAEATQPKPTKIDPSNPIDPTWRWPLRGTLLERYRPAQGQQGIVVQSQRGQAIKAARGGRVVYSGDSLKGYGHLIIVKHDDRYLSAYAHTEKAQVREGQWVASNAVIAQVGLDNARRSALHFQIRLDGSPIDPISKLPRY